MLPKSPLFRIPAALWVLIVGIVSLFALASFLTSAFNFVGFLIWLGIALIGGAFGTRALWRFSRVGFDIDSDNITPFYIKKDSNRS